MNKKTIEQKQEAIIKMMRTDFGIHNSVAWSIMKKIKKELIMIELKKLNKEFLANELDELGTMLNQIKIINGAIGEVKEKEKIELCQELQKDIECNIRELKTGEFK